MIAETGGQSCGCGGVGPKDVLAPPDGGAGGGISFCSGQGFSPLPNLCHPYPAPIGADFKTFPPPSLPTCPPIS